MRNLFIALGAFIVIYASNDNHNNKIKLKNDLDNDNDNICYIQYLECINSDNNNKSKKQLKTDIISNKKKK